MQQHIKCCIKKQSTNLYIREDKPKFNIITVGFVHHARKISGRLNKNENYHGD